MDIPLFGGSSDGDPEDDGQSLGGASTRESRMSFGQPCVPSPVVASFDFESQSVNPSSSIEISARSNRAFFETSLVNASAFNHVKLPWETGVAKQIFSEEPFDHQVVPTLAIWPWGATPTEAAEALVAEAGHDALLPLDATIYTSVVKSLDDKAYFEQRASLFDAAIQKLWIVISHCFKISSTGRQIVEAGLDADLSRAHSIIQACMGLKSPSTVVKRANSLVSFIRWCLKAGIVDVNPFTEANAWAYFCDLKKNAAPATRAASCMSAFRFALHVLGFESLSHVTTSRRLIGLSDQRSCVRRCL